MPGPRVGEPTPVTGACWVLGFLGFWDWLSGPRSKLSENAMFEELRDSFSCDVFGGRYWGFARFVSNEYNSCQCLTTMVYWWVASCRWGSTYQSLRFGHLQPRSLLSLAGSALLPSPPFPRELPKASSGSFTKPLVTKASINRVRLKASSRMVEWYCW